MGEPIISWFTGRSRFPCWWTCVDAAGRINYRGGDAICLSKVEELWNHSVNSKWYHSILREYLIHNPQ